MTAAIEAQAAGVTPDVVFRERLLFIAVLSSFLVMLDVAPHELIVTGGLAYLLTTRIKIARELIVLIALMLAINLSGVIAALPVLDRPRVTGFVSVSLFLAAATMFYALLLSEDTQARFAILRRAWIIAATCAALAGIAGYFNIAGSADLFTAYGATRAKGTFNDPNVFGPFLIPPAIFVAQDILTGRRSGVWQCLLFLLLCLAQLLSFSRASWGHFAGSLVLLALMTLVTTASARLRLRLVVAGAAGVFVLAMLGALLLSLDSVGKVFAERASLQQSYDVKTGGRFDNYLNALDIILSAPLGLGPFAFAQRFGEDAHNAYLNTFLSYGWVAGFSYIALTIVTLCLVLSGVRRAHRLRADMIALAASYVPLVITGLIIHTDHWRHYFLLVSAIWALAVAMQRGETLQQNRQNHGASI